jgi:hypothetical protein
LCIKIYIPINNFFTAAFYWHYFFYDRCSLANSKTIFLCQEIVQQQARNRRHQAVADHHQAVAANHHLEVADLNQAPVDQMLKQHLTTKKLS